MGNIKKRKQEETEEAAEGEAAPEAYGADAFEGYLRECIEIDRDNVNSEFVRVPSDLAFWNEKYADALGRYLRAERHVKSIKALIEPEVREQLIADNGKTTEPRVKAAIESDARVRHAYRRFIDADVERTRIFGRIDAIRAKKDSLISLGAQLRSELEGDPSIRLPSQAHDDSDD